MCVCVTFQTVGCTNSCGSLDAYFQNGLWCVFNEAWCQHLRRAICTRTVLWGCNLKIRSQLNLCSYYYSNSCIRKLCDTISAICHLAPAVLVCETVTVHLKPDFSLRQVGILCMLYIACCPKIVCFKELKVEVYSCRAIKTGCELERCLHMHSRFATQAAFVMSWVRHLKVQRIEFEGAAQELLAYLVGSKHSAEQFWCREIYRGYGLYLHQGLSCDHMWSQ